MKKSMDLFYKFVVVLTMFLSGLILLCTFTVVRTTTSQLESIFETKILRVLVLLVASVILIAVLMGIYRFIGRLSDKRQRVTAVGMYIAIIVIQVVTVTCLLKSFPKTDNYRVVTTAMTMAKEGILSIDNTSGYFARYTNNYFVVIFLYGFYRLLMFFNIDSLWNATVALNTIIIDASIVLTYFSIKKMMGQQKATYSMGLMLLCPTTYLWMTFTYTNTFSLIFCSLLLYLTLFIKEISNKARIIVGLIMGVVAGVGFAMRATMIIPIIAVSIYLVMELIKESEERAKRAIVILIFLFTVTFCILGISKFETNYIQDAEKTGGFPITHWLMLGVSEKGGFTKADVEYTQQFETKQEKIEANLEVIKNRISKLGIRGSVNLLRVKLTRVWADGSDDCFYVNNRDEYNTSLYDYINGNKNILFACYVQAYRIITFLFIILSGLAMLKSKSFKQEFLFMITLLGAIVFFIFWEANIKYNISFIFIMLVLMTSGASAFDDIAKNCMRKSKISYTVQALLCTLLVVNAVVMVKKYDDMTETTSVYKEFSYYDNRVRQRQYETGIAEEGKVVEQTFSAHKNFTCINVLFNTLDDTDGSTVYSLKLIDENDQVVAEEEITANNLTSSNTYSLKCNETCNKDTTYKLQFSAVSGTKDTLEIVYVKSDNLDYISSGIMTVNDSTIQGDLYLEVYEKVERAYTSSMRYIMICVLILVAQGGIVCFVRKRYL